MNNNTQRVCEYCGTIIPFGAVKCPACEAKVESGSEGIGNPSEYSSDEKEIFEPEKRDIPQDVDVLNETMRVRHAAVTAVPGAAPAAFAPAAASGTYKQGDPSRENVYSQPSASTGYAGNEEIPDLDSTMRVRRAMPSTGAIPQQTQNKGFEQYRAGGSMQGTMPVQNGMPFSAAPENNAGWQEFRGDIEQKRSGRGLVILLAVLLVIQFIIAGFVRPGWFRANGETEKTQTQEEGQ